MATGPKGHQILFQGCQLGNPLRHMLDVRVQQEVHIAAPAPGLVPESQQVSDLVQRHVQRPAFADEGEAFDVGLVIAAVIGRRACRGWNQAFTLIEADRLHLRGRSRGQVPNLHERTRFFV